MPMNKPRVIVPGIGKIEPSRPVRPNARKRLEASGWGSKDPKPKDDEQPKDDNKK